MNKRAPPPNLKKRRDIGVSLRSQNKLINTCRTTSIDDLFLTLNDYKYMINYFSIQHDGIRNCLLIVAKKTPLRIILLAILPFVCIVSAFAAIDDDREVLLTLNVKNKPVQDVLEMIESQTTFHFFYNNKQVDAQRVVSIDVRNENVFAVIDQIFKSTNISYKVLEQNIILSPKELIESDAVQQQTVLDISGKVVDAAGLPIIGVNVIQKNTSNGTITDIDGRFTLKVPAKSILVFSYISYSSREVPVGNNTVFAVTMVEDSKIIDEVVVTALGIKRDEKALGYAVQKLDGERLTAVKTTEVATSLTGKVAGLNVQNSTEFNQKPKLLLRGQEPLLVVDGVPYNNVTLSEIAADDIEKVDVLKGATASALYGARGGVGVIMVTTKRGKEEGFHVGVNSSTMFQAGYLKLPEVQSSYSTGMGSKYNAKDFIWGDKLDIGRTAEQWDPFLHEWREQPLVSKGKNNFKNFLETSLVTNNNINISQKGKYGSFRTSLTHVYNKGQYPNMKLNKFTYSVSGDIKWEKFTFEGGMTFNKRIYPNDKGAGYGRGGFIYNLLVWTGTDYDVRDYKNYWIKKDEKQNWMNTDWYDNPYLISHEILRANNSNVTNAFLYTTYDFTPWLKASLRSGMDYVSERIERRNPISAIGGWDKKGYYGVEKNGKFSMNHDLILTADHRFGDFTVDGFIGGTIYYMQDDMMKGKTSNGLFIPGYYSLKASNGLPVVEGEYHRKQVNSLYGRVAGSWKSTVFMDVTTRNDWSSTLPSETRSYLYPSASLSVMMSEFMPLPAWVSFWKIRGSWTQTKRDLDIYEIIRAYTITTNAWDGYNAATYPAILRGMLMSPSSSDSWEFGTSFHILNNRIRFDLAYYRTLYYNQKIESEISDASGFEKSLINFDEELLRSGVEVIITGDVIKRKDFEWNATLNWALDRYCYNKIDPVYSAKHKWVAKGKRKDWLDVKDWERDPQGNIVHENGFPIRSKYISVAGYSLPDWVFGLNNMLRYKNISLGISIDGRVGGVAYNRMNQALWNTGAHPDSDNKWRYSEVVDGNKNYVGKGVKIVSGSVDYDAQGAIVRDDRVFAPNDKEVSYETYIRGYHSNAYTTCSQNVFEQTFFKLRELSLSYSMPKSICKKMKLKGLQAGIVGQNLFIWTKEFRFSDPDIALDNLNSPSIRYVGFNFKIDF